MNKFSEVKRSARYWWIALIQGVLFLGLGLFFIFSPSDSLFVLIQLLAVYWFLSGSFTIVEALIGKYEGSRFWGFIAGLINTVAGIFMLAYPFFAYNITAIFWMYFIGITSILSGIFHIIEGNTVKKNVGRDWSWGNVFLGFFNVVFGVLLVIFPLIAATAYIWIIGIFGVIGGIALLATSYRLHKVAVLIEEVEG